MHAVTHCTDVAAHACSPQCAPPVRQLKIFYRPSLPKASHKQKCANLLRGFRPMRAAACAANGMRCAPCARLDAGDAANIFHRLHAISSRPAHARNPTPRQSRRVRRCRARAAGECTVVEHRQRLRLRATAGTGRSRADRQDARHRQAGSTCGHRHAGKKMAAPTSGHPGVRRARRGQCASSSSSSA